MKIESICIVGGCSSGWMTAALLSSNLKNIKITVVEPKNIPTIGVGESTMGHINRYLAAIGLSGRDKDFMSYCDATYKLSIRFNDFKSLNHSFQYPFGLSDYSNCQPEDWFIIKQLYPDFNLSYSEFYNPITYLANENKIVFESPYISNFRFNQDTAYHLDAVKFGQYLKEKICIPNGVKVIRDTIKHIELDPLTGEVVFLTPESSPTFMIKADLYIDCTGFKSLLLEQSMGSEFISFKDTLLNDTALAGRMPYEDQKNELINVTDCTALKNGWVWNTPTWERMGTGYVYSSQFTNDENAELEFRKHLEKVKGKKRADEIELRKINIRHGKRKHGWCKNVVGIGLSYAFLEPLEATGLFTTHENALRLLDALERRNGFIGKIDIDAYNLAVDNELESMREFIVMHYVLSERTDSSYWRYINNELPVISHEELLDKIVRTPRLYKEFSYDVGFANKFGDLRGTLYIAGGFEYSPISKTECLFRSTDRRYIDKARIDDIAIPIALKNKKRILRFLKKCPSSYDFLRTTIYD